MSDTCQYCGEEYSPQGLPAHERACDERGTDVDAPEGLNESDIETILERDGEACVYCYTPDALVIHVINPYSELFPQNYATLCMDCETALEGLHPRTKRTAIQDGP